MECQSQKTKLAENMKRIGFLRVLNEMCIRDRFQIAAAYAHALRLGVGCRLPWSYSSETWELIDVYKRQRFCRIPQIGLHKSVRRTHQIQCSYLQIALVRCV